MIGRPEGIAPRLAVAGIVVALGLHAVAAVALPTHLAWGSTVGILLAEIAALAVCTRMARGLHRTGHLLWGLLACSILLHIVSSTLDLRSQMLGTDTNIAPGWQVLFSTLFFVPLMLAASLRLDRRTTIGENSIHAALSIVTGALFYVLVFSLVTAHGSDRPEDIRFLARLFDVLDLYVATAFTVRALGSERTVQHTFFARVSPFLWVCTLSTATHNAILIRHDYIWLDVLVSGPYLFLAAFLLCRHFHWTRLPQPSPRIAGAIRSASPIFLCFGLVLLGLVVSRWHFRLGAGSVLVAVLSYAGVSIAAQSRGIAAEASLLAGKASLEQLVRIDGLTEVPNRRAFDERLLAECGKVARSGEPLSLLMIDIDHFKKLNDHNGHLAGDACLKSVAQRIRRSLPRSGDFVARFGGEEFAVLLPGTDRAGAQQVARQLHTAIANLHLPHTQSEFGRVTVSIGGATSDAAAPAPALALVRSADAALYESKIRGRDRTEWSSTRAPQSGRMHPGAEPA